MRNIGSRSIKANYILNVLRIASIAVIGIFTIPHVSRVLGPDNLGKVEYVYTIINYFVLFSGLGIPMYGIREVSKCRDNPRERNKVVLELYLILFVTTIISYVGIIFIYHLNYFQDYKDLILILSSMVFLSNIGAEWYFQGTENQLFITVRNVILRLIVFGLIIYFINHEADYKIYAFLLVLATFGANILNFIIIIKGVLKEKFKKSEIDIRRHLKPILTIFVATISVNIYLQLDNLLIGSISGDRYVGYYSIANKLIRFVISFITIIGAVLLPRVSYLYLNDKQQYQEYIHKSFNILALMSIPFTIFFFVFADQIVFYMGGEAFTSSVLTMKILSPLCFIVSMAYFMGFIILYPQNKEKIYTFATIISAIFSLCINYFAISYYQQNGAAVIAVVSELLAIAIMYYYLRKQELLDKLFDRNILKIILAGLGMFVFAFFLQNYSENSLILFILLVVFSFSIYVSISLLLRERFSYGLVHGFIIQLKNRT